MKLLFSIITTICFLNVNGQLYYYSNYPNGGGAGAYTGGAAGTGLNVYFDGTPQYMFMAHNLSAQIPAEIDSTKILLTITHWGNVDNKVICEWDSINQIMLPSMLSFGDPINSTSNFYSNETQSHLTLLSYDPVTQDSIGNFTNYLDTNYVGLNCILDGQEYYGWGRINVTLEPYDGLSVFPFIYSFEWAFCQDPITAGEVPECAIVGTAELPFGEEITAFPTPARNKIWLTNYTSVINKEYQIMDPTGKIIRRGTLKHEEAFLDVSLLPSGVYFLQIDNTPNSLRIVVDNQ